LTGIQRERKDQHTAAPSPGIFSFLLLFSSSKIYPAKAYVTNRHYRERAI
jgi:hypothetical protein